MSDAWNPMQHRFRFVRTKAVVHCEIRCGKRLLRLSQFKHERAIYFIWLGRIDARHRPVTWAKVWPRYG